MTAITFQDSSIILREMCDFSVKSSWEGCPEERGPNEEGGALTSVPKWHRPAPPQEPRDESGEERESWPRAQRSRNEDRGIQPHRCMANRWGDSGNSDRLYFGGSQITADGDYSHEIRRCLILGRKAMTNLDSILKSRDHYFANKGPSSQSYGFSSSHVWMWELDCEESWGPKN